jgi:hypothetical protein
VQNRDWNMGNLAESIAQNFVTFRPWFAEYQFWFGICELLNLVMVGLSMAATNLLLLNKFWM